MYVDTVFCRAVDQPLGAEGKIGLTLEPMDVGDASLTRKYDRKTLKDENGKYPPWMNQRKIKKHRSQLAKKKQKHGAGGAKPKQSRKKKGKAKEAW